MFEPLPHRAPFPTMNGRVFAVDGFSKVFFFFFFFLLSQLFNLLTPQKARKNLDEKYGCHHGGAAFQVFPPG